MSTHSAPFIQPKLTDFQRPRMVADESQRPRMVADESQRPRMVADESRGLPAPTQTLPPPTANIDAGITPPAFDPTVKTTLSKVFPKVDKICDAKFFQRNLKMTKKDATTFILRNQDPLNFFTVMEQEIEVHNNEVQGKIELYFQTIPEIIAKGQREVKMAKAEGTVRKKQAEKAALRAEIMRELEEEKQRAQIRQEQLNMPATPANSSTQSATPAVSSAPAAMAGGLPRPNVTSPAASTHSSISSTPMSPDLQAVPGPGMSTTTTATPAPANTNTTDSTPDEMDLEQFFECYFEPVISQGLLRIMTENGQQLQLNQVRLNSETGTIDLSVQNVPVTPKVTIKRN